MEGGPGKLKNRCGGGKKLSNQDELDSRPNCKPIWMAEDMARPQIPMTMEDWEYA